VQGRLDSKTATAAQTAVGEKDLSAGFAFDSDIPQARV